MVVAQLVERLLLTPEIGGSIPTIAIFIACQLYWNDEIKDTKRPGLAHFVKECFRYLLDEKNHFYPPCYSSSHTPPFCRDCLVTVSMAFRSFPQSSFCLILWPPGPPPTRPLTSNPSDDGLYGLLFMLPFLSIFNFFKWNQFLTTLPVWPVKISKIFVKVSQKWFHYKN